MSYWGSNFQNQPDHIRRLFIARPGRSLVQNDYEGAEAVAVALLCGEGNFRELVKQKVKHHNYMCPKLFPDTFKDLITPEEIQALRPLTIKPRPNYKDIIKRCKESKVEYDITKKTIHGYDYGMGWRTLTETVLKGTEGRIVLSPAQAKSFLGGVSAEFPEVRLFQLRAETAAKEFTPIANLFGHEIVFCKRYTSSVGRTAISWGPQSTVGICMILAACKLQDYIEAEHRDWNILTITHDSGLVDCPEDEAVECSLKLAECMDIEFTSPIDGWKYRIGIERQKGKNWGKYHERDNPLGVKVQ